MDNTKGTPAPSGNLASNPNAVQNAVNKPSVIGGTLPGQTPGTVTNPYQPRPSGWINPQTPIQTGTPTWNPSSSTNAEITPRDQVAYTNPNNTNVVVPKVSTPTTPDAGAWGRFTDWVDDQDWFTGKDRTAAGRQGFRSPSLPGEAPEWFPTAIAEMTQAQADKQLEQSRYAARPTSAHIFNDLGTGRKMYQHNGVWFDVTTNQQLSNVTPGRDTGRSVAIPAQWTARPSAPRTSEDVFREYASILRRGLGV